MSKNGSVVVLPAGNTFRIGEVSELTQLPAYVLRYWETEFPSLQPSKSPHGQRLYRQEDIETVLSIKRLLYEQGFTIAGARRQLHGERNGPSPPAPGNGGNPASAPTPNPAREALQAVRAQLVDLLTHLSRR